jgi:ABC-type multidrug transport system permease subunit
MKILPTTIEEQINRVDRQRSLYIGISAAALAVWSVFRVIWSLYIALTFAGVAGSLLFPIVLWAVIGTVAAIAAVGFLIRYSSES